MPSGTPAASGRASARLGGEGATGPDVRATLCTAALALLADGGIAAFDLDLVDGRAGLPPGTCRGSFHSEAELFTALFERTALTYHTELRAACDRHPDDVVLGIVEWLGYVLGPARRTSQVIWALLLDPGIRAQVTMYADALQARWIREVAAGLGRPAEHVDVAWGLVEGWIGRCLLHDLPLPRPDVVAAHIRALFGAMADQEDER